MVIRRLRRATLAMLMVIAVLTAGCGDDSSSTPIDETSSTIDGGSTSTPPTSEATTSSTTSSSTTVPATTGSPTTPLPDADLPGTAFETAPSADQILAVVGVQLDDTLNVRLAPGTDSPVVAELAPLAADFTATGRARKLTSSAWWEVTTADGIVGWVSSNFAAIMGSTSDVTSVVVSALGEIPKAETMTDLGTLVAETIAPDPETSRVTLSVAPSVGDLGEVTYDVVGLGDDAISAVRLHVFGQPLEGGEGFGLKSVEQTDMCARAFSEADGVCV